MAGTPPTPLRILVTAGPTREPIDTVRYISNRSSGKTGYQIARSARRRGHDVTLISGPVCLTRPKNLQVQYITTANDLLQACLQCLPHVDAIIMTAAVCDYRTQEVNPHKIKKSSSDISLHLVETVDVAAHLGRQKRPGQILIGFALEDNNAQANARGKLNRKNLDAIVLNSPPTLDADTIDAELIYAQGTSETLGLLTKQRFASRLVRSVESMCAAASSGR